jgi:hypothetical protein
MRRALLLVSLIAAITHAGPGITIFLTGAGTVGPYQLGHDHILLSSEKLIYHDQPLFKGKDYEIDYNNGYILFSEAIPIGDTILARFEILPLNLKINYSLIKPTAAISSNTGDAQQSKPSVNYSDQELELMGSQRFIVNIGNRGEPSLSQGLDLNITGQLAPGVSVKGSISDRNFDNASGNTSSLDELDKVLLHLDAPNLQADFGDLNLAGIDNSLLDFNRKLTGLDIISQKSDFSGSSALAFSPGKQIELFFFGVDGKQGPYFIGNQSQSPGLTSNRFLAGTEEIYIDGKKLSRGNENDYTIDYYEGYLEFTPKIVISSRNRITVKIQAADEGYRRTFYYGKAGVDKGLKVEVQFMREGDDRSRPRAFDMGESQANVLNRVGANADSAYLSGATFVGEGLGDYFIQVDSLNDTVYVYVGADSGAYQANFSQLGQGRGAYQYAGAGKYIYVGRGNGSYLPIIYYPLPAIHNYGSLIVRRDGPLYFNGELAISQNDRNTLSSFDKKLIGYGFNGSLGWQLNNRAFSGKTWSGKGLEYRLRNLNSGFQYPGYINPVEFSRQYNLPEITAANVGQLAELQSSLRTVNGDYYDFGGGHITQDSINSDRGYGKIGYITFNRLLLSGSAEIARSYLSNTSISGWWNKYETAGKIVKGAIQPTIAVRHEIKTSIDTLVSGIKADEYETGLGWNISSSLNSASKVIIRNQDYSAPRGSIWRKQYNQYQLEQQIIYGGNKSGISIETNLARLFQDIKYPNTEKITRNLGSLKINYTTAAASLTFYENVNGTARVLQSREYIFVGKGKGDYRRDGNDYVPEQGGEYVEIIRQLGDQSTGASGYQITGGVRSRYDGAASGNKSWNRFGYENDLAYRQNLRPQINLAPENLFPVGRFNSIKLSYRNYNFRQKIKYRLGEHGNYLYYTLTASQNLGSQYQFENLESRLLENMLETKLSTGRRANYLLTGKIASDKQTLYSGRVDISRVQIGVTPDYQITEIIRFSNLLGLMREREKVKDLLVTTYSITPKIIGNIPNFGRLEFEFGYSSVRLNRNDIIVPYVLASSKKPGDNFNLLLNGRFKLNRYGNLVLLYNYKKLGDGYSNYNFRVEARAEF